MRSGEDDAAFETLMQDLCLAFNRPYTPQLSRVFWESTKHLHLAEVQRAAKVAAKSLKKFPTPKDLIGDGKPGASAPQKPVDDLSMSRWAAAANVILMRLAYQDIRRGTRAIAEYPPA